MKNITKQFLTLRPIIIFITLVFIKCWTAQAAVQSQTSPDTLIGKETPGAISLSEKVNNFEYRLEGRSDPFMPFISDKADGTLNPNDILENDEQLTGMQLFEPGQLTLVALVNTSDQKFAMVEDVSGKGYIINEGTKIGRRGVVRSISPNKVLIEEIAMTRAGKKLTSDIVMVLRKEENKK
jgi:type IV pilus assembly protein PilP